MSVYIVQPGDTPMVIAQKITGNPTRMVELVRANAHKSSVVGLGRIPTFRELHVGESLTVPPAWESSLQNIHAQAQAKLKQATTQIPSAGFQFGSGSAGSRGGGGGGAGRNHGFPGQPPAPYTVNAPQAPGVRGLAGYAIPQPPPAYAVRPRAGADGGGDDSGHGVEPILTIMGHRGVPAAQRVGEGVGKACCGGCASGGPCTGCEGQGCGVKMPPCSASQATPSIPGSTSFPVGFGQTAPTAPSTVSTIGDALSGWGVPLAVGAISIAAGFGLAYVISNR